MDPTIYLLQTETEMDEEPAPIMDSEAEEQPPAPSE